MCLNLANQTPFFHPPLYFVSLKFLKILNFILMVRSFDCYIICTYCIRYLLPYFQVRTPRILFRVRLNLSNIIFYQFTKGYICIKALSLEIAGF